jgi:hypothetical protein
VVADESWREARSSSSKLQSRFSLANRSPPYLRNLFRRTEAHEPVYRFEQFDAAFQEAQIRLESCWTRYGRLVDAYPTTSAHANAPNRGTSQLWSGGEWRRERNTCKNHIQPPQPLPDQARLSVRLFRWWNVSTLELIQYPKLLQSNDDKQPEGLPKRTQR